MISASRSYQNNVEVMNTSKELLLETLRLGQLRRRTNAAAHGMINATMAPATRGTTPRGGQHRKETTARPGRLPELMVAQLKNQDPFKPMDRRRYVSQLAQFSPVSAIADLQTSFDSLSAVAARQPDAPRRRAGRPQRDRAVGTAGYLRRGGGLRRRGQRARRRRQRRWCSSPTRTGTCCARSNLGTPAAGLARLPLGRHGTTAAARWPTATTGSRRRSATAAVADRMSRGKVDGVRMTGSDGALPRSRMVSAASC